jgi:large subunit ribosomal protein L18
MTDHVTNKIKQKRARRERAHLRVRARVRGTGERPRLSVYKSLRYIYAQVIDDTRGVTLAAAASADPALRGRLAGSTASQEAAKLVGELVAERARKRGIEKVVFDRGGYVYHGNVKALAEAARGKGLQF